MSAKKIIQTPAQRELDKLFAEKFRLLGFDNGQSSDAKLCSLTAHIGMLAGFIEWNAQPGTREKFNVKNKIRHAAAFALGWLESITEEKKVVPIILAERERQQTLYKTKPEKYLVIMNSPVADDRRKLRVLVEELGEVGDAIDRIERAKTLELKFAHDDLREELSQVVAVCVAWLETPEVKS